jgi:hypothetical protein
MLNKSHERRPVAAIAKSAIMMLVIVVAVVGSYEIHLRNSGFEITYDDGPELWSDKRKKVYGSTENQIVFIGSSRIKFDLDIPTWREQTGIEPIQLACVGSSPVPVLRDLANDPNFKGRLIVDVTEPIFFSNMPFYMEKPNKGLKYFHDHTLAQDASFEINHVLESQLTFLDKEKFAMNAQLDLLPFIVPALQNRPGVFQMPIFPMEFDRTTFDRQTYMSNRFAADTSQVNIVRSIWKGMLSMPMKPMTDKEISIVIADIKASTDKIKKRGGNVIFVRTPSSGPFRQGEKKGFARERFWDKLLAGTQCAGIHFEDYAATRNFQCPEFSHLQLSDARKYTTEFVKILSQHPGWEVKSEKLITKL